MSLSDDIGLPGDPPASAATTSVSSLEATEGSGPGSTGERRGVSEGLVLGIWALIVVVAVVLVLTRAEDKALHDPVKKAQRGEITGLGELSLLRADRFAGALTALGEKYPDGRPLSIRVDPVSVSATLRVGQYGAARASVDPALKVHQDGEGETTEKGLTISRIDPAAPERLVRKVNARTGTAPTDVDYLVLSVDSTSPRASRWALFLRRGTPPDQRRYTSDLAGRDVQKGF